ncbi:MAG: ZIP family metal transporter [bacterium]|nr:ZIP family metal transporter [bacterium]
MLTLVALIAFATTFLGGLLALKYTDRLHLVLGFSAGSVIGVAFFDLLPESLALAGENFGISIITSVVALGFVAYLFLDRCITLHAHTDEPGHGQAAATGSDGHCGRGIIGAGSLSIHSFLDGIAVGLAFQVSAAVGAIVAVAVLAHGFSDGINTVSIILKNGGSKQSAFKWLATDALAPVMGIFLSIFFTLPEHILGIALALFCGFFLYIGASDLLPESHHQHPTLWTTVMTALGIAFIFVAVTFAGI